MLTTRLFCSAGHRSAAARSMSEVVRARPSVAAKSTSAPPVRFKPEGRARTAWNPRSRSARRTGSSGRSLSARSSHFSRPWKKSRGEAEEGTPFEVEKDEASGDGTELIVIEGEEEAVVLRTEGANLLFAGCGDVKGRTFRSRKSARLNRIQTRSTSLS